eukprot:COSAG01_NODE_70880_length_257_cov_0.987342_1_plen_51_part_10
MPPGEPSVQKGANKHGAIWTLLGIPALVPTVASTGRTGAGGGAALQRRGGA